MSSRLALLAARTALILLVPMGFGILVLETPRYLRFAEEGVTNTSATRNTANEMVLHPSPNGSAARAGVVDGDVLLAVDGVQVDPGLELIDLGLRGPVGSTVVLDVRREGGVRRVPVVRSADLAAVLGDFGITVRGRVWYLFVLDLMVTLSFTLAGVVILLRGWHRPLGVLLAVALLVWAAGWTNVVILAASTSLAAKVIVLSSMVGAGGIMALFPDGRLVPRWASWLLVAWGGIALTSFPNPVRTMLSPWIDGAWVQALMWMALVGASVAAQVTRYRFHSDELQRRQIRVVVLSLAATFVGFVLYQLPSAYLSAVGAWEAWYRYELIAVPLATLPIALIPVAIAVAVSRHGLWNVDTLINRSAVYSLITLVLGTVWAATAVLLQATLSLFIGGYSTVAAAAVSSLQVAALFEPMRRRTQAWVDQHFPRESYVVEQRLQQLARDVAHSLEIEVVPFVDQQLRSILGSDAVRWQDGRVRIDGPSGKLQSKEVRRALETFAQTTAPYIAMREAIRRALEKDATLPR